MPKTVLIPLRPVGLTTFSEEFRDLHPAWRNIKVEFKAKYLGFYLGPERGHTTYDKPLAKYRQRAKDWGAAGAGLALFDAGLRCLHPTCHLVRCSAGRFASRMAIGGKGRPGQPPAWSGLLVLRGCRPRPPMSGLPGGIRGASRPPQGHQIPSRHHRGFFTGGSQCHSSCSGAD